ncbi:MAG: hypothetical protein ACI965_001931 [Paraglaciecola sp.]|jgi:hypothetical protein
MRIKMKYIALILAACLSFAAVSDELTVADEDIVQELKQFCEEVAAEDGTGDQELQPFLLGCVNKELSDEGYFNLDLLEVQ